MKTVKHGVLCLSLIAGMIALGGCKGKTADEGAGTEVKPAQSTPAEANTPAVATQADQSAAVAEVQADESKPVSEVKTEADKMDASQLRAAASAYQEAIAAKKAELEKVAAQLKEIPVTDLLGEKAKQLKTQVDGLAQSIDALKTRFDVYYTKLKETGGDLSGQL